MEVRAVMIFNDATRLYIRERKCLGEKFETSRLHNFFFIDLAVKVYDRPVGPDRSRLDTVDAFVFFDEGDLHIGILPALFREYLYANIIEFVGRPAIAVVAIN